MTYCENIICFPCICIMHFCGKCFRVYCCCNTSEVEPEEVQSSS